MRAHGRRERPAPKASSANIRRAPLPADAVAEDNDLVAATGQSVDHVDRLRESRVIRVDDLGDKDETHGRLASARATL